MDPAKASVQGALFEQFLDICAQVGDSLLESFAHLISFESADPDVLASVLNKLANQVPNSLVLVPDEWLFHQACLLIKLGQPSLDNLLEHLSRFVFIFGIRPSLF